MEMRLFCETFSPGYLPEVEAFAERLDKEMNTDLESDCEIMINHSKIDKQQSKQIVNTTTSSKTKSLRFDKDPSELSTIKSIDNRKKSNNSYYSEEN